MAVEFIPRMYSNSALEYANQVASTYIFEWSLLNIIGISPGVIEIAGQSQLEGESKINELIQNEMYPNS